MHQFFPNKNKTQISSGKNTDNKIMLFSSSIVDAPEPNISQSSLRKAQRRLEKYGRKAKALLSNEKKMESFLLRLEEKLRVIPKVGDKLAYIPILAELLNNYFHKTYRNLPLGTIIAIVATLVYFVSPVDAIPDFLLALGYADDVAVIAASLPFIKSDIDEYLAWRTEVAIEVKEN